MQQHTDSYNPMMQLSRVFNYYFITETVVCVKRERNGCINKKQKPELQREVQTPGFLLTSTQLVGHGVKCV